MAQVFIWGNKMRNKNFNDDDMMPHKMSYGNTNNNSDWIADLIFNLVVIMLAFWIIMKTYRCVSPKEFHAICTNNNGVKTLDISNAISYKFVKNFIQIKDLDKNIYTISANDNCTFKS